VNFADFILAHSVDDPAALALARGRYADFPEFTLALSTLEARRKLRSKVPEWLEHPSLRFPLPLSAEQCSSTETALYKAQILQDLFAEAEKSAVVGQKFIDLFSGEKFLVREGVSASIADLTGGLGVDAWAFALAGAKVLYNDMKPELVEAARHNLPDLLSSQPNEAPSTCHFDQGQRPHGEISSFRCAEVTPGSVASILDGFKPDAFFLDPARRSATGGKVFRIADCSPDVTALLPELFAQARYVLVKLSPMLDITLGARELGTCVREVHVVGSGGECKELLFLLDREHSGDYTITVYDNSTTLSFTPSEERIALPLSSRPSEALHLSSRPSEARGEIFLFEPGKALLKAGCFKLLSQRFSLAKPGVNTHLYFADSPQEALTPFGKWYRIIESAPLDKRSIKSFGQRYPSADVTARDVHMTSEDLLKRLRSSSKSTPIPNPTDSPIHIFSLSTPSGNLLLSCTKA